MCLGKQTVQHENCMALVCGFVSSYSDLAPTVPVSQNGARARALSRCDFVVVARRIVHGGLRRRKGQSVGSGPQRTCEPEAPS
jgi:hypothetical protein